jgi:hypothetical protein
MRLVLVHGRQQQGKDAVAEKASWIEALRRGMAALGLELPVAESDVRFAYYGDALDNHERGRPDVDVIVRGDISTDPDEVAFAVRMLAEANVSAGHPATADPSFVDPLVERGVLQSPMLRGVLQALNDWAPEVGALLLRVATHDVYSYISNETLRRRLDAGVAAALDHDGPSVVVGHSLGSVVAHSVLRSWRPPSGHRVPLFLTLGSPLGVGVIQERLRARRFPPVVDEWVNAFDPRDTVALAPLADEDFPPGPVRNHDRVVNDGPGHHGIEQYLADPYVARVLHAALTAE